MTTHIQNISHSERLEMAIHDIVDEKAILEDDQYILNSNTLDRDEFLNLCILCFENNNRDLGNIFSNNCDELSSCVINYLKPYDYDNELNSRDALLRIILKNIILEYRGTIQEMIDEACNKKQEEIIRYYGLSA